MHRKLLRYPYAPHIQPHPPRPKWASVTSVERYYRWKESLGTQHEGLVKLWDIGTNAEKLFAGGAGGGAEGAVGSTHGAVLEPIASFNTSSESEDVNAVAFSPNGQWLITMTESLQLWNVESAEHSKTLEQESDVCKDMGDGPKCGSFSADGTKLAVACDNGEVKILEMVPR